MLSLHPSGVDPTSSWKQVPWCFWWKCVLLLEQMSLHNQFPLFWENPLATNLVFFNTSISNKSPWKIPYSCFLVWLLYPKHHSGILQSLLLPWVHYVRSSTYPSLLHSTLKVRTHFTLGKFLIKQGVVHPVVSCRTRESSAVTPIEEENHPPSGWCTLCIKTICTGVIGSILCYWYSMYMSQVTRYQDPFILNFVENFILHPSVSLLYPIGLHLQPCSKG